MIPKKIHDQCLHNYGATWIAQMLQMEVGDGDTAATVYQASPPPVRPPPSAPSLYVRTLGEAANPAQNAHPAFKPVRLHRPDEQVGEQQVVICGP